MTVVQFFDDSDRVVDISQTRYYMWLHSSFTEDRRFEATISYGFILLLFSA